jgi:hypothetical protein
MCAKDGRADTRGRLIAAILVVTAVCASATVWAETAAPRGPSPSAEPAMSLRTGEITAGPDPTTLSSPSLGTGELFGDAVATSGPYVVIGADHERADGFSQAGHAWVYDTKTGTYTKLTSPNAQTSGHFGFSVAISGSTVLVGAPLETAGGNLGAGNAYTFNAATGALIATFSSPSIESDEAFGWSVAISGSIVVVGAPLETAQGFASAGHAWIFNTANGSHFMLSGDPQTDGEFGSSVAISDSFVVVGAPGETSAGFSFAGNIYTFESTTGDVLTGFGSPNAQTDGRFGFSVAIRDETELVGAPGEEASSNIAAGHAYTFDVISGIEISEYTSPSIESNESFGWSVAINATDILVSATFETASGDANGGHAWMFVISTGVATKLTSPNVQTGGEFGWSVAMDGKRAVVGAPGETVSGDSAAGHAYVY